MAEAAPSTLEALRDRLDFVVGAASRAVSVHNSQPWRFRLLASGLELLADRGRQLAVADPRGRELMISCGAALFNARLALRMLGYSADVTLLPDPQEADLLARLVLAGPGQATVEERRLFAAIPHRHTHRSAFTPTLVPRELLVTAQEAVASEGALLHFVEHPGSRRSLSDVVAAAERAQQRDPAVQAELAEWTVAPGETRPDGVPPLAYPARGDRPERVAFPIRDFAAGRGWGSADPSDSGTDAPVMVLTTTGDQPADWLVAGQALQRLLLLGAARWVFAALFSQPLESPDARVLVRDELGTSEFPQMILQLGHSPSAPATPRRPVDDVLANGTDSGRAASAEH